MLQGRMSAKIHIGGLGAKVSHHFLFLESEHSRSVMRHPEKNVLNLPGESRNDHIWSTVFSTISFEVDNF